MSKTPGQTHRKTDHRTGAIDYEVAGLAWLASAGPDAAAVVSVLEHGSTWLLEPQLTRVAATATAAEDFGRALACTHAAGACHFGAPPPGFSGDAWMGLAPLPLLSPAQTSASWGEFYAKWRIAPYMSSPVFTSSERSTLEALCEVLTSGSLDHEQPELVRQTRPGAARTHGDLWSGNVMWTPSGAVLIDPAAQGGHAEEDLAALAVFGCSHLERIRAAYEEVSPLADGWRERVGLHQMHILMVHCVLFGRSYVGETLAIARRFARP